MCVCVYVSTYNWNFTPKYPMDNLFVFRLAVEWGTTQDFLASKLVPLAPEVGRTKGKTG